MPSLRSHVSPSLVTFPTGLWRGKRTGNIYMDLRGGSCLPRGHKLLVCIAIGSANRDTCIGEVVTRTAEYEIFHGKVELTTE